MLSASMIVINEPSDGWDQFERLLLKELVLSIYKRMICVPTLNYNGLAREQYKKAFSNMQNAFILMAVNEAGYTQQDVATMLGISQVAVQKRLKNTTQDLRKKGM